MTDSATITLGTHEHSVTTEVLANCEHLIHIDGRDQPLEGIVLAQARTAVVAVEGRVVVLYPLGEGRFYEARTRRVVRVERTSARRAEPAPDTGTGAAVLRAPMPGRIVRVLVNEGDAVLAGAGVVVIEAMKMENQLLAPRAGTVRRVAVQSGDAVESDALLLEIE